MSELFSLEGRTALVTGGSRGIGRMIAEGFLRQGARVYISARKADACNATAAELSGIGPCFSLPADVSTAAGVAGLVAAYLSRESALDILVNIASIDGQSVNPQETYSYAASKAGLIHLTKRMALRLVQDGIVVNALCPGAFASEMNRAARDQAEAVAARIPARRIGVADDMASAAIYLASRAGDYVVGTTLTVDGGVNLVR